jgi:hypothetical protein
MRTVTGGLLVAVGLLLFYLIISGRLKAGLVAYHAAVDKMTNPSGAKPTAGATATPANPSGLSLPALPTLPTLAVS